MFRKHGPNLVESDEGFSVEILGRTGLRYREGGRSIFIDSEPLASRGVAIYPSGIRDEDPSGPPIRDDERERLLRRVLAVFEWLGEPADIVRPSWDAP